jgi:hypothetical protein
MKIDRLKKAIAIVRDKPVNLSAQSLTYLRTYQSILEAVAILPRAPETFFSQVAIFAYGWMPRVARINPDYYKEAGGFLVSVAQTKEIQINSDAVSKISECLHSVIGASKVLHFVRPDIYPIWDSKVAKIWYGKDLPQTKMSNPKTYIEYAEGVHELKSCNEISAFLEEFKKVYSERLEKLNIPVYQLGSIRAIESAIFELSISEHKYA